MESFWKWLMRANARGVSTGLLAALLFVVAWWLWSEFRPPASERLLTGSRPQAAGPAALGIGAFLDAAVAEGRTLRRADPFTWVRIPRIPVAPPPPVVADVPPPPTPTPPPPTPPPAAPAVKPRETVTLVYRGVYRGADGRASALLKDSRSGKVLFHPPGADFSGVRVSAIHPTHVNIVDLDGAVHVLRLGESTQLEVLSLGTPAKP